MFAEILYWQYLNLMKNFNKTDVSFLEKEFHIERLTRVIKTSEDINLLRSIAFELLRLRKQKAFVDNFTQEIMNLGN
tara:strand:- start:303 stop:533 length:231 start_codon:yes stop_codon:yes gene_type:complete